MTDAKDVRRCRSCGAAVVWMKHEKTGKSAPIDTVPSEAGNVLPDVDAGTYRVIRGSAPGFYTSHFATCPNAASHRRNA